MTLIC
jgi:hypothetical protein